MQQVVNSNGFENPIFLKDCHQSDIYFMLLEDRVYFLCREIDRKDVNNWVFSWQLAPAMMLDYVSTDFYAILTEGLRRGGKIYMFEKWGDVIASKFPSS